jgi:hypothetical protein
MADEASTGRTEPPAGPVGVNPPAYDGLRWSIRITGIILMFGGMIYLGMIVSSLLWGSGPGGTRTEGLFPLVVSLVTFGLGIFVLRTGLRMFRSVDASTIAHFSFVFALVYTFILVHILPLSGLFQRHAALMWLLLVLYFGLSYWILKRILLHLLLPEGER